MALSKITNDLLNLGADTSSLNLPKGTNAQRPSSPVAGTLFPDAPAPTFIV